LTEVSMPVPGRAPRHPQDNGGFTEISDERTARWLFALAPAAGPARFQKLKERFGSAAAALKAPASDWTAEDVSAAQAARWKDDLNEAAGRLPAERALVEKHGARLLIDADEEYPAGLKTLDDRPIVLYIKGDWRPLDALSVAIVGSRTPTAYGRAVAERLAGDLAKAGVTVVSGLARGIDTAAHQAAVGNKGRTTGVLGSGLDQLYPRENARLADRMAAQGAVISEFPMTTPPDRPNFPRRNRLIAALSLATVVVEAREASGALITARLAAEQGREVFAVPGSVLSPMSKGPHRLLKQGARVLESVEDIFETLEPFRELLARATAAKEPPAAPLDLSEPERKIWKHVSLEPAGVDGLAVKSGLAAAAVSSTLLNLELKGLVRLMPGKTYVRTDKGLRGS